MNKGESSRIDVDVIDKAGIFELAGSCQPLDRIIDLMADCACVVESPYMDFEYWEAYSLYYSRAFAPIQRACRRLHWFRPKSGKDGRHLRQTLLRSATREELFAHWDYAGFAVLRPSKHSPVGPTALALGPNSLLSGFRALPSPIEVHLLSYTFAIDSPWFVQQDAHIAQCASSSIWMSTRLRVDEPSFRRLRMIDLQRNSGTHPTLGWALTVPEMVQGVCSTGLAVHIYHSEEPPRTPPSHLTFLIDCYASSGRPVILLHRAADNSSGHAVTAVARQHSSGQAANLKNLAPLLGRNPPRSHVTLDGACGRFLVHDDIRGPFVRVDITSMDTQETATLTHCENHDDGSRRNLVGLLVPMAPQITALPIPGLRQAVASIDRFFEEEYGDGHKDADVRVVWKTTLAPGYRFKESLWGLDPAFRRAYGEVHFPRYVWVYEYAIMDVDSTSGDGFYVDGEVIMDATAPPDCPHMLSWRLGELIAVADEQPYLGKGADEAMSLPIPCYYDRVSNSSTE